MYLCGVVRVLSSRDISGTTVGLTGNDVSDGCCVFNQLQLNLVDTSVELAAGGAATGEGV
jgi:hypothetical protein